MALKYCRTKVAYHSEVSMCTLKQCISSTLHISDFSMCVHVTSYDPDKHLATKGISYQLYCPRGVEFQIFPRHLL